jgi:hypothetical protein
MVKEGDESDRREARGVSRKLLRWTFSHGSF